jgi:PAS domain S-box-containing protein
MSKGQTTYHELEKRLAEAESIVEVLKRHEVDAVVGKNKIAFLLLQEVTEALRNSEAGFRAMFELPGVGMFQADAPAFRFTRISPAFSEMTGYPAEELLTMNLIGLTHPQDRVRHMTRLAGMLRGGTDSWSIEKRFVRKDGRVIPVQIHGAVVRDESGRAVKIMAMISDITARKSAGARPPGKPGIKRRRPRRLP